MAVVRFRTALTLSARTLGKGKEKEDGMDGEGKIQPSTIRPTPGHGILRNPVVGILLVVGLGLLAYSNTFHVPFHFDDEPSITDNRLIKDLGNFLSRPDGYTYNPRRYVAYLTLAINHRLGGLEVAGYHAFNIAVHLGNALLVFALILLSFRTPFLERSSLAPSSGLIAVGASLLFVVHPLQTQAVTYVVQRMTSLATFFSLASLFLYARWRLGASSGKPPLGRSVLLYASSLLSLVLAMRTKEIAFTIPILIVVYDWFFFETVKVKSLAPFLLTLLILPAEMLHVGKPVAEVLSDVSAATRVKSDLSRVAYLLTQITVVATYLRLLLLPVNQNLDYDYPIAQSPSSGPVILSALTLLAVLSLGTVLYFRSRPERKNPAPEGRLVTFGIAWFFITLLVESSVIPIADVIFEHRIYLPSFGFFTALSVGVAAFGYRWERKIPGSWKTSLIVMALAASVLAGATFLRNHIWGDEVRLWADVVKKSPRKARPYYNLGLAYDRRGNPAEAMRNYITSISLDPYNGKAHDNLGNIFAKQGRFQEAIREFRTALSLDPGDAAARNNLGNVFAKMGRFGDALGEFRKALASDPENADTHFNIGIAYSAMGDVEEAMHAYSMALKLAPGHGAAHNNLGLLLARKGRLDEASMEFQAAVAIDPSDAEAWNNLGIIHAQRGDFELAVRTFREALGRGGDQAEIRHNLGRAYLASGNPANAVAEFQESLRIDPGHAGARRGLDEALVRLPGYR